jgi:hypothetical protein
MANELFLVRMVENMARESLPSDPDVEVGALAVALNSVNSGASVSEAYREARRFVRCWASHPSHRRPPASHDGGGNLFPALVGGR